MKDTLDKIAQMLPDGFSETGLEEVKSIVESAIQEEVAKEKKLLEAKVSGFLRTKISDLKDVAMDYTERVNELDIKETELSFDNFIQNLLNSRIFKNVNVLDLQEEFSFYELLKSTGVFTKSWGNKKF